MCVHPQRAPRSRGACVMETGSASTKGGESKRGGAEGEEDEQKQEVTARHSGSLLRPRKKLFTRCVMLACSLCCGWRQTAAPKLSSWCALWSCSHGLVFRMPSFSFVESFSPSAGSVVKEIERVVDRYVRQLTTGKVCRMHHGTVLSALCGT